MNWLALAAGCVAGAANYLLLAAGCKRFTHRERHAAPLILGGMLIPVAGLALLAAFAPRLLAWFGCAAGGTLTLLAFIGMLVTLLRKRT